MKFVKYSPLVFCLVFLASCLKDTGNYSYKENNTLYVDSNGIVLSYEGKQNEFQLQISPKVIYSGDATNLTYLWRAYPTTTTYDTLSTTRALNVPIKYTPGTYRIEYIVTEKSTGLRTFMRYSAVVVTPGSVPAGWLMGYETAAGTDIDLIRSPDLVSGARDTVIERVYSRINGMALAGKPLHISYLSPTATTYLFTTQDAAALKNPDLAKFQSFNQMFLGDEDPSYNFVGFAPGTSVAGLVVNGKHLYWGNGGYFVGKVLAPDGSDNYEAAGAVASMTARNGVFYDQQSKRFMIANQNSSFSVEFANASATARFNLNGIGKKLVHMERGYTPVSGDPYKFAFFKDETGNARYLYIINTASAASPDISMLDISNAPDILNARYYAVSNKGPAVVYATGSQIYSFTVDYNGNAFSTPVAGFTVPANEEITEFKMTKSHSVAPTGLNESARLLVATWDASAQKGKVYLLAINETSGIIQPTPITTFNVGGRVGAMGFKSV